MNNTGKNAMSYYYSEILKMQVVLNEKTGEICCEDKTMYTMDEVKMLNTAGMEVDMRVHLLKKVFNGEIVEVKKRHEVQV
jgi:hypothetical protein